MDGLFGFWLDIPRQRRKRIVLFAVAVATILLTLWAARSVLGLYFVGIILAYILGPLVDGVQSGIEWLAERIHFGFLRRGARSLSIVIISLLLIAAIVGFVYLVIPIVAREAEALWGARESIWERVSNLANRLIQEYELLPQRVRQQIDDALQNLTAIVTQALQQAVQGTVTAISYTTSVVLAITIVPFWTYFLLRDFSQIRNSVYRSLPSAIRADVRSILTMFDHSVGAWIRGQLLLMIIIGIVQTIVLTILGIDYALLLGVVAGLLEVVPNIGPTLAAIPAILVALTRSPGLALITAIAANLIQNLENSFVVPRVLGESVGLHPVVMMVMLVVGTEIAGLPGLILAPIMTAVLRDVYRYLSFRFADEPFSPKASLERALAGESFTIDI
ncbi:MAG: AI-2E family transporter [Anaerolineae bacterium]